MATITKEFEEIELSSGKVVNLSITVTGVHESHYGADADGNRGVSKWFIDDWSHEVECDDELNDDESVEAAEKAEELVDETDWDFENASDEDDDDFEDDDY